VEVRVPRGSIGHPRMRKKTTSSTLTSNLLAELPFHRARNVGPNARTLRTIKHGHQSFRIHQYQKRTTLPSTAFLGRRNADCYLTATRTAHPCHGTRRNSKRHSTGYFPRAHHRRAPFHLHFATQQESCGSADGTATADRPRLLPHRQQDIRKDFPG